MEKRWVLREADEEVVSHLSDQLKVTALLARILVHRGVMDPDAGKRFFHPVYAPIFLPPS